VKLLSLLLLMVLVLPISLQAQSPNRLTAEELARFQGDWPGILGRCVVTERKPPQALLYCDPATSWNIQQVKVDAVAGTILAVSTAKPPAWPKRALRKVGHVFENALYVAVGVGAVFVLCQSGACS
jgi:hypothetical protein